MGALFLSPRGSLSPAHTPPHHIPPSPCLFVSHFPSHFPSAFFLKQAKSATKWPTRAGPWLSHTPRLSSILSYTTQGFYSCQFHSIPHPAASSLWGHRVRRHQSCWKALPYLASRAKSALRDSGNRSRRWVWIWYIFLRSQDKTCMLAERSDLWKI